MKRGLVSLFSSRTDPICTNLWLFFCPMKQHILAAQSISNVSHAITVCFFFTLKPFLSHFYRYYLCVILAFLVFKNRTFWGRGFLAGGQGGVNMSLDFTWFVHSVVLLHTRSHTNDTKTYSLQQQKALFICSSFKQAQINVTKRFNLEISSTNTAQLDICANKLKTYCEL